MLTFVRSIIGLFAIVGFVTAVVLLILVEWKRVKSGRPGFVPYFHRIRRIVTGFLMIVLLGLCFYGWWFMKDSTTIRTAEIYMKSVFTLLSIIFLSLLWDCVAVYKSMDSFFDGLTSSNPVVDAEENLQKGRRESQVNTDYEPDSRDTPEK